ncbi:hypothetical protein U9K47_09215 [Bacillus toyonensis]|uniref:hypothetical protein n=1 Tax=Bacillus toyonensis TaxID=155322 RepID=UPI003466631D
MRMTITISEEGKRNLEKSQEIISKQFGGGKVTQGFAIGYALKEFVENAEKEKTEEK